MANVAKKVAETLKELGVRYVFGVPSDLQDLGFALLEILDLIFDDSHYSIPFVLPINLVVKIQPQRHEGRHR